MYTISFVVMLGEVTVIPGHMYCTVHVQSVKWMIKSDSCVRTGRTVEGMLEAIGSTESCDGENACCDACGVDRLVPKLMFEESRPVNTVSRKRRSAVFTVTEDAVSTLAQALRQERDKYLDKHRNFAPFGPDCVCSNSLIDHICTQAKFISEESDLDAFFYFATCSSTNFFQDNSRCIFSCRYS